MPLPDSNVLRISDIDGITILEMMQTLTLVQGKQVLAYLAETNRYQLRLWDLSHIHFPYTMDELIKISEYSKSIFHAENKFALLVGDELGYGMSRELMVFRSQEGISEVRTFRDRNEALHWLKEYQHLLPNINSGLNDF